MGSRGYNAVRISLIGPSPSEISANASNTSSSWALPNFTLNGIQHPWTTRQPFRHRWRSSYDLGVKGIKCAHIDGREDLELDDDDSVKKRTTLHDIFEAECRSRCDDLGVEGCSYFTYWKKSSLWPWWNFHPIGRFWPWQKARCDLIPKGGCDNMI